MAWETRDDVLARISCAGKKVFEWSRLPERERRAGFGGSGAGKTEQKEKKIDVNVNI